MLLLIMSAVALVLGLILVSNESFSIVTIIVAILVAVLFWKKRTEMAEFFDVHLTEVIIGSVAYVVFGLVWSFIKWISYAKQHKKRYSSSPKAADHKDVIIGYISYWPLSIISSCLIFLFEDVFRRIYESVSGIYDKLTDRFV